MSRNKLFIDPNIYFRLFRHLLTLSNKHVNSSIVFDVPPATFKYYYLGNIYVSVLCLCWYGRFVYQSVVHFDWHLPHSIIE